jgi:hypothetical protein
MSLTALLLLAALQDPDRDFPAPGTGTPLAGELVEVDAVNRRGALRLLCDGSEERYHNAPSHRFDLLPYGSVRYHGSPAELRDVPLGTILYGTFFKPPEKSGSRSKPGKYEAAETRALLLEDAVSHHRTRGLAWKVVSLDAAKGKLKVDATGPEAKGSTTFDVDPATRVWKGRGIGTLADLTPGLEIQMNLGWAPDWRNGQLHVTEAWADEEALKAAAERQREVHLRYERVRGVPARIDHVEHRPGGSGILTMTFFGGRDPSLYETFQEKRGVRVAAAEPTLRTWWADHDYKSVRILEARRAEAAPPGCSGLTLRADCAELIEGFRPGRIVRVWADAWPRVKLPPEERVQSLDQR